MNRYRQRDVKQRNRKFSPNTEIRQQVAMKFFICDIKGCNFKCDTKSKFINHVISHQPIDFFCGECNIEFKEQIELTHHNVIHHGHLMCYKCDKTAKPSVDYNPGTFDPPIEHDCRKTFNVWDCDSKNCINGHNEPRRFTSLKGFAEHMLKEHNIISTKDMQELFNEACIMKDTHMQKGLKVYPIQNKISNEGLSEIAFYANYCVRNGVLYIDASSDVKESEIIKKYDGFIGKNPNEKPQLCSGYKHYSPKEKINLGGSRIDEASRKFNNLQEKVNTNSNSEGSSNKKLNLNFDIEPQQLSICGAHNLPYVNNQNYLSSIYNVEEGQTITSSDQQKSSSEKENGVSDFGSNQKSESNELNNVFAPTQGKKNDIKYKQHIVCKDIDRSITESEQAKKRKYKKKNDISVLNQFKSNEKNLPIMNFEDLGFDTATSIKQTSKVINASKKKNSSKLKKTTTNDYKNKVFTNPFLSYDPAKPQKKSQGLMGVFGESTKFYNNQKNTDNADDKCLKKRGKIVLPKKIQDENNSTDEENCKFAHNKQKNYNIGPMEAKKSRKQKNNKNKENLKDATNKLPTPVLPIFKNNYPGYSNGVSLSNLI